jgi:histone H2B
MPRGRKAKEARKYKKSRRDNFSVYIYKVLKEVHPEIGISRKAMNIMNSFMLDSFDQICLEGARLARYTKR